MAGPSKLKSLIDIQDDDLTLARAFADSHKSDFDDAYLYKLEVLFRENGQLTSHQWNVLQRIMEKYGMTEWSESESK